MASNYGVSGHGDLDTIFRAIGTGVRPGPNAAATGLYTNSGAQDLNARYNGVNGTGLDLITYNTSFNSKDKSKDSSGDLRWIFQSAGYN